MDHSHCVLIYTLPKYFEKRNCMREMLDESSDFATVAFSEAGSE